MNTSSTISVKKRRSIDRSFAGFGSLLSPGKVGNSDWAIDNATIE
jgi:hypothetical protein